MVVLLPALEKAPEELSNLGKIIIASLKAMMAAGLGDEVEGDYRDVILRKPTNSPSPFVCIMDEYGYYAVPGFAVVPAQARSLGFSAVFAGQDLPAFQKASKEEAASIGANCNIKMCMKLEDPQETFEFFNKVAAEAFVTSVSGFQMENASISLNYMDTRNASIDRRQRIDVLDLKDQAPGQAHIFFKSKIIRADVFYASPKPVKRMRLNQYLKIEPPSEQRLTEMDKRFKRFKEIFSNPKFQFPKVSDNTDIDTLAESLAEAGDLQPFERGLSGLISILEHEVEKQHELNVPYEEASTLDQISIFTRVPLSPLVARMIGKENEELFSLPLLRHGSTQEDLKNIERLCGHTEVDAEKLAENVSDSVEEATLFPPKEIEFTCTPAEILKDIKDLIKLFGGSDIDTSSLTLEETPGKPTEKIPPSDILANDLLADLPNDIFDLHLKDDKKEEDKDKE
jgi:intracellular multiplication protein IcmO